MAQHHAHQDCELLRHLGTPVCSWRQEEEKKLGGLFCGGIRNLGGAWPLRQLYYI